LSELAFRPNQSQTAEEPPQAAESPVYCGGNVAKAARQ
jgi:hypothetical protein